MKLRFLDLIVVLFGLAAASVEASELASPAPADLGAAVFKLRVLEGTGRVKNRFRRPYRPGKTANDVPC